MRSDDRLRICSRSSAVGYKLPNTLASHNNYLSMSGNAITNIHGDKISISIPKGYTNITVYLTT